MNCANAGILFQAKSCPNIVLIRFVADPDGQIVPDVAAEVAGAWAVGVGDARRHRHGG